MLEGSILRDLEAAHQSGQVGKRRLNFGVYYKNTLVALCHALEDCILSFGSSPLVITAFQRGKWYLQEADRYAELAERSRQVVIMAAPDAGFAEHPTSQRSNVELVNLDVTDPVAQEWHLVILSPSYTAMVLCQELSPTDYGIQGVPTADQERKFYGFWTFEANLVQETVQLAIDHIRRYDLALAQKLTEQVQTIATETQTTEPEDLSQAVSRVVDYLQTSQYDLSDRGQAYSSSLIQQDVLGNNLVSNEVQAFLRMAQLTDQGDTVNPMAAAEVATLAETLGQMLDLPVWQLHRLRLAGLLHRLSPLQQTETELSPSSFARYDDLDQPPSCPLVPGAQVLRTMPQLRAIATIITHQTERWNGQGQPAGLAGDEIPLESRILGLVVDFQRRLASFRHQAQSDPTLTPELCLEKALAGCQKRQGERWDPKLVDTLVLLVSGLRQGLSLPVALPKIAAGIWLVDSHCDEDLLNLSRTDSLQPTAAYVSEQA